MIVASNQRWALMCETPEQPLDLAELAARMDHAALDLVLVEGFKDEPVPKIALWRRGIKGEMAYLLDEYVIALASDDKLAINIPLLDINQPVNVADFIENWLKTGH